LGRVQILGWPVTNLNEDFRIDTFERCRRALTVEPTPAVGVPRSVVRDDRF